MKDHHSNVDTVVLGKYVSWKFNLKTAEILSSKTEINILDESTGETMQIQFKPNTTIEVGPFKTENFGRFIKTFKFFYFD